MRLILGYTGRVADHEKCAWASAIFERSGSIKVRRKATLTINEGIRSLENLQSNALSTEDAKQI